MREAVRAVAVVMLALAAGCAGEREERSTAEALHLVRSAPGTLPPTYTLADETRPVLAVPPEVRVQVSIPSGLRDEFTFPVPSSVAAGEMIATGILQRRRVESIPPTVVRVVADPSGNSQRHDHAPGAGARSRSALRACAGADGSDIRRRRRRGRA